MGSGLRSSSTGLSQNGSGTNKIALIPLDAGPNPPVRLLDPDPRVAVNPQFTPDGSALVYPIRENGVDNLWLQPLDGSRGRQITAFETDLIQAFSLLAQWSDLAFSASTTNPMWCFCTMPADLRADVSQVIGTIHLQILS